MVSPISSIRLRSHVVTRAIYEVAMYSVSQIDRATTDYFLDLQIIRSSAFINIYPVVKWLVNESPVQSESE
jgi:hypothetical protein